MHAWTGCSFTTAECPHCGCQCNEEWQLVSRQQASVQSRGLLSMHSASSGCFSAVACISRYSQLLSLCFCLQSCSCTPSATTPKPGLTGLQQHGPQNCDLHPAAHGSLLLCQTAAHLLAPDPLRASLVPHRQALIMPSAHRWQACPPALSSWPCPSPSPRPTSWPLPSWRPQPSQPRAQPAPGQHIVKIAVRGCEGSSSSSWEGFSLGEPLLSGNAVTGFCRQHMAVLSLHE